jgi:hypothetical protein
MTHPQVYPPAAQPMVHSHSWRAGRVEYDVKHPGAPDSLHESRGPPVEARSMMERAAPLAPAVQRGR